MPFSDLKDLEPEESDTDCSDSNHRAGEEVKHHEEEDDIVNREDLGRHDEDPVHGVEDIDVAKDVTAASLADRVLGFVDEAEKH